MDFDYIERVVRLVEEADITELEVESKEGLRVLVKKHSGIQMVPQMIEAVAPQRQVQQEPQAAQPAQDDDSMIIRAPMVGTFYSASAPESDDFVEIGTKVNKDSIVCILEAMKVMNEIKADVSGVISEIMVKNSQPVEYGTPLFKVKCP
jgi:acetyl-CoA carboxylase biotin carboxyl carrier protein